MCYVFGENNLNNGRKNLNRFAGLDLPISAWIMRSIIDFAYSLLNEVIGFKALFLHSLPEAENFYVANRFNP